VNKVDDDFSKHFSLVLLEEVSRIFDGRVGLALATRDHPHDEAISPAGDRVLIAERTEPGLLKLLERLPSIAVRLGFGVVRCDRHEHRKLARSGLVFLRREGGVVGRDDLGGELGRLGRSRDIRRRR
jgi:hypothetical protein